MFTPLLVLCFQTIMLWIVVALLHRFKNKITLIPIYSFIALLTIVTQNFSDLGFAITLHQWYFHIASISYFTPIIFAVLILYLFEGPRATRNAFWIILFSTLFYESNIYLTGLMTDTSSWITINPAQLINHFWSLLAVTFDIFFMTIFWEILSKAKKLPLLIKVFLVTLFVLVLDSFIFTTGVFGSSKLYFSMLSGNLLNRFILSIFASIFINFSLQSSGFTEENREKPNNIWEVLNFKSDLETKIKTLEEFIVSEKVLKDKISQSEETFKLAITGAGAGIWDWDTITDKIFWSPKFCTLLGYLPEELEGNLTAFKKIIHHDDLEKTFRIVSNCFATKTPFVNEYRLQTKSGEYRWFLANGIAKYNSNDKPIRMVGSIIDINDRKIDEISLNSKVAELTQLNSLMVDREIKMAELKEENKKLKA